MLNLTLGLAVLFTVLLAAVFVLVVLIGKRAKSLARLREELAQKEAELQDGRALFEHERAEFARMADDQEKREAELIRVDEELDAREKELIRWEGALKTKEDVIDRQKKKIESVFKADLSASGNFEESDFIYPDFDFLSAEAEFMKRYCRWRAESENADPADAAPKEAEFAVQAERFSIGLDFLPAGFTAAQFLLSADCYEMLEIAARLTAECLDGKLSEPTDSLLNDVLQLCADSYWYLKTANISAGIEFRADPVQQYAYDELIKAAKQNNVFLYNLSSPADVEMPGLDTVPDFLAQIRESEKRLTPQPSEDRREPLRQKIRASLKRILELPPGPASDWKAFVEGITELIRNYRVSYKSGEIRRYLTPILDRIPDDVEDSETFRRAIQYVEVGPPLKRPPRFDRSEDVKRVRKAYGNTRVVFIGGTPQPHIQERLIAAFKLSDLVWEEWTHGDSLDRFDGLLRDGTVQLFLIYIPWCSHKHSRDLPKAIEAAGKKYVRLRKGTGVNLIAAAICDQVIPRPAD